MARKQPKEQGFGSDSFLDVLANMVGILIILIVIAGLRVSRTPVIIPDAIVEVTPAPPSILDEPVELGEPKTLTWAVEAPPPEIPPPRAITRPPAPLAPLSPPKELVEATSSVQADTVALEVALSAAEEEAAQRAAAVAEQDRAVAIARQQLAAAMVDQTAVAKAAQAKDTDLKSQQAQLAALDSALREARKKAPKVKILKHSLTPVSQLVRGTELHFRLAGNRVSQVPIDTLVERLQAQIQRQRDFLLTQEYYESSVGPLDGYRMEFVLERAQATPAEVMSSGVRLIKLEVTGWSIRPERGIVEEPAEQALRQGSHFIQTIEAAGVGATLTFWVYPDSFELHRALQEYAQSQGYRVAARPLPEGVPIAGSPRGSKSLAQ